MMLKNLTKKNFTTTRGFINLDKLKSKVNKLLNNKKINIKNT